MPITVTAVCSLGVNRRLHYTEKTITVRENVPNYTPDNLMAQAVGQAVAQSMQAAYIVNHYGPDDSYFSCNITFGGKSS